MSVRTKEVLKEITLYKAASTIESVKRQYGFRDEDIIKLEANENRYGCSPNVIEALKKHAGEFSYYPDLNATEVRGLLSEKHNVDPDNIIFGTGSFELLTMVGLAFIEKGDEAIAVKPSFNWYTNCTVVNGGTMKYVEVDEKLQTPTSKILESISGKTKVIWLCNPNNPTGAIIPKEELKEFLNQVPESVLVVLDEAYIDFAEDYIDTIELTKVFKNVLVLRSFSKSYGLASFRLGYGIAGMEIIDNLSRVKCPCNLNFAALAAAKEALLDQDFFHMVIENSKKSKALLYRTFDELGFDYVPSSTNFIFVHTGIDSTTLREAFLKYGIMVRKGSDYGYDDWMRLTLGTYEENEKVAEVLKKIVLELRRA